MWEWARKQYPEAFVDYEETFGNFPFGTLYDADYFNSCVLKDLSKAKTELAVRQLHQVCTHMATPKRCRSASKKVEKAQCVKSCKEAGYFSNTFGDCSKG